MEEKICSVMGMGDQSLGHLFGREIIKRQSERGQSGQGSQRSVKITNSWGQGSDCTVSRDIFRQQWFCEAGRMILRGETGTGRVLKLD